MTRARDLANIADGTFTATDLDLSGTLTVSGDATFDTNTLFVDVSANAVGVGTTNPQKTLDVTGTFAISNSTTSYWDFDRNDSDGSLTISDTGSEKVRLDTSGNLGLGVVPTANDYTGAMQLGYAGHGLTPRSATDLAMSVNAYHSGGGWKYGSTNPASLLVQSSGFSWYTAGSGTAGTSISFTPAMTLDTSGNLLVGTTSATFVSTGRKCFEVNGATNSIINLADESSGSKVSKFYIHNDASNNYINHFAANGVSQLWWTQGSERMRLDTSGALLVGTTTSAGAGGVGLTGQFRAGYQGVLNGFGGEDSSGLYFSGGASSGYVAINSNSGNAPLYISLSSSATTGALINFADTGTGVGYISTNGTTTAYNTSSDARLKENIADAEDAGAKVDAIQVRQFDWKADGSHQDYGMIAQELMTVAPEAVSGDPESDDMMGVDYSKLVPMMLKEIQSLRARVAQLEGA